MCSSTLGPAMPPSLLTWPTIKRGISLPLQAPISSWVHSRTWVTLPAEEVTVEREMVWMESTTTTSGFSARMVS